MRNRSLLLTACAGVVFVLAVAGGAVAGDSPTSWPGTVQTPAGVWGACFNKKTGALRFVNVAAGCRSGERRASWSQIGPKGPTGDKGPDGATGPQGPTGERGERGSTGAAGAAGPEGPAGPQGAAGPEGPQGDTGAQGQIGPDGAQGPQGDPGPTGPQGAQGPAGPQGDPGPSGPQGGDGPAGAQGPAGSQGPTGLQGPTGAQGPAGAQGDPGPQGAQGATGPEGPTSSAVVADAGVTRSAAAGNTQGLQFSDTATCPVGEVMLGGGARLTSTASYGNGLGRVDTVASYPSGATTWTATMLIRSNFAAASNATIAAYVVCTT